MWGNNKQQLLGEDGLMWRKRSELGSKDIVALPAKRVKDRPRRCKLYVALRCDEKDGKRVHAQLLRVARDGTCRTFLRARQNI